MEFDGHEYVIAKVSINSGRVVGETRCAFLTRKCNVIVKQCPRNEGDIRQIKETVEIEENVAQELNDVSRGTWEGNGETTGSLHHSAERRCLRNLSSVITSKCERHACVFKSSRTYSHSQFNACMCNCSNHRLRRSTQAWRDMHVIRVGLRLATGAYNRAQRRR